MVLRHIERTVHNAMEKNTTNNNFRALKELRTTMRNAGMLPTSESAFIEIINPCADFEHYKGGFPSLNNSKTNVLRVPYKLNIGPPEGATGPWDCNIFMPEIVNRLWPQQSDGDGSFLTSSLLAGGMLFQADASDSANSLGGLTYILGPQGCGTLSVADQVTAPSLWPGTAIAQIMSCEGLCPDPIGDGGFKSFPKTWRKIGSGCDIRLVANDLENEGTVTTYEIPEMVQDVTVANAINITSFTTPSGFKDLGSQKVRIVSDVPRTASVAITIPGSKYWDARDGVYMVSKMNSTENPFQEVKAQQIFVQDTKEGSTTIETEILTGPSGVSVNSGIPITTRFDVGGSAPLPTVQRSMDKQGDMLFAPFNTVGAYFEGLNQNASLEIEGVFWIECLPNPLQDLNMVLLAEPSAPYDPVFFTCLIDAIRNMPSATPVCNNESGKWFYDAVHWLTKAAKPIVKAVLPAAWGNAAAGALSVANEWAGSRQEAVKTRTDRKNESKPQKSLPSNEKSRIGLYTNEEVNNFLALERRELQRQFKQKLTNIETVQNSNTNRASPSYKQALTETKKIQKNMDLIEEGVKKVKAENNVVKQRLNREKQIDAALKAEGWAPVNRPPGEGQSRRATQRRGRR